MNDEPLRYTSARLSPASTTLYDFSHFTSDKSQGLLRIQAIYNKFNNPLQGFNNFNSLEESD
jgi:hypothetical protein